MNPLLSPTFVIGYIRVDSIEGASALNIGNNWPTNFQSYKKHNQGFGTVKGNHNEIQGARTLLNDPDLLDVFGSPEQIPEWLKEMLLNIEQTQTDSGQTQADSEQAQPNSLQASTGYEASDHEETTNAFNNFSNPGAGSVGHVESTEESPSSDIGPAGGVEYE